MKKNSKLKTAVMGATALTVSLLGGVIYNFHEDFDRLIIGNSDYGMYESEINTYIRNYPKALSENPSLPFSNYMIRYIQTGIENNGDGTYSFLKNGEKYTISRDGFIRKETFTLYESLIYDDVVAMKSDVSLTENIIVKTQSYSGNNIGGAYYDIVSTPTKEIDGFNIIALDNGLYAVLHPIFDTVTVGQFGAKGDGVTDDTTAIQRAIASDVHNVLFETGNYRMPNGLTIATENIAFIGESATINGTILAQETTNVGLYFLNFVSSEARDTITLNSVDATDIYHNTIRMTLNNSLIAIKGSNGSISIENNNLYTSPITFEHGAPSTISIDRASDSINIENNYFESTKNNRILSFDNTENEENAVKFIDNTLVLSANSAWDTDAIFTVNNGPELLLEGNRLTVSSPTKIVNSENSSIVMNSNNIDYNYNGTLSTTPNRQDDEFSLISGSIEKFTDNTISIRGKLDGVSTSVIAITGEIVGNNFRIDDTCLLDSIISSGSKVSKNRIFQKGTSRSIISDVENIENNTIQIDGNIDNIFEYSKRDLIRDAVIEGNTIDNNYDEILNNEGHTFISVNDIKMNGYKIEVIRNISHNSSIGDIDKSRILYFAPGDENQAITIRENDMPAYLGHRNFIADANHNCILDGNDAIRYAVIFVDYDGTLIKSDIVKRGESATAPANPKRNGFNFIGWDQKFDDVQSDLRITALYVERPADIIYDFTKGANQTYNVNSNGTLNFTVSADSSKMLIIYIDDKEVSVNNYDVKENLVLSFHRDFSTKLTMGKHTLKIAFDDGYAMTDFQVVKVNYSSNVYRNTPIKRADASIINDTENTPIQTDSNSEIKTEKEENTPTKQEDKIIDKNKDQNKIIEEEDDEEEKFTVSDNIIYYGSLGMICTGLVLLIALRIKKIKEL